MGRGFKHIGIKFTFDVEGSDGEADIVSEGSNYLQEKLTQDKASFMWVQFKISWNFWGIWRSFSIKYEVSDANVCCLYTVNMKPDCQILYNSKALL